MEYAPIIIPTLNRITHLRRTVESLQRNTYAPYTELIISIDYPPSEKYFEGYSEVVEYVKTIEGFKKITLFFQKENLGPYYNDDFLRQYVLKNYSCFIFTEDDNEFAPCFIEYMDKALERFWDRDDVFMIEAQTVNAIEDEKFNGTYMFAMDSIPYGIGFWSHKEKKTLEEINHEMVVSIVHSFKLQWRLFSINRLYFNWLADYLAHEVPAMNYPDGRLAPIDITRGIYSVIYNKYVVFPVESLSKTWGRDGSGVHCNKAVMTNEEIAAERLCQSMSYELREADDFMHYVKCNQRQRNKQQMQTRGVPFKREIRNWMIFIFRRYMPVKMYEKFIERIVPTHA